VAWRDVVRRPLVRRGQDMEVVATSGALTVTLNGIALNDAASGESVRVRNPDSKKEFVAQVVSESRATIRF
jgi:flagella basal body P-ring formation protein FlgA